MRAAGKPRASLRWYKHSLDHKTVIFTGRKMDYKQVDGRYFVAANRDEEKNLVIRDVITSDAGRYTIRDEFSRQTAHADLMVIGNL